MESYSEMFRTATGHGPYPYRSRFAEEDRLFQILNIPTGAGKTSAVVLGWLWRRRLASAEAREFSDPPAPASSEAGANSIGLEVLGDMTAN